ncbi:cupin domain-containing protein [uncultured Methanospirillum sp.]|uniref:cupin domain-containing protein n=1 Tax=uncultured Methanospirillum sp. TaxID=262503 RepID=UPI0029C70B48|nr:cupin domain-containing protein [uncultured Methanospirillum sp.]
MECGKEVHDRSVFPVGERITNENFIGPVWLEILVSSDTIFNCPIYNVTFEPGTRNNWHKHPGGQILLVTNGNGYYQEEGKPVQTLKTGDVISIHPDVKHWHGATPDSWFTHLAISTNPQKGEAQWLEPVPDDEYHNVR